MATNVIEIPANLVKTGDVVVHNNKEYLIVNILRLGVVQLQYSGGYFNYEWDQAVKILDKRPTTDSFAKPTTTRAVLAHQVRPGDTLSYGIKFFDIKEVKDLGEIPERAVRLIHETGYFDFSLNRIVHIVNKPPALETPTATFSTQITPVFLPYEEAVKPFSDEEDVKGADVEVGDVIWINGNWALVTNVYKHPNSPFNKVNVEYGKVKGLQVRLTLTGIYSRKVRAVMETLNIQNAIEAQRILLQKLEQMLDLQQLAPTVDGKIAIGNCNIRVDKASIVKAARDEMKVAASKSAELIKKL
uniref:Band 7 domain-containing protein n=1 Tax=Staphylococcus phage Pel53 TaxID=3234048 RepID=A0AB39C6L1_9CAUD